MARATPILLLLLSGWTRGQVVSPDCVYNGKDFNGSEYETLSHCTSTFGGDLSVAFSGDRDSGDAKHKDVLLMQSEPYTDRFQVYTDPDGEVYCGVCSSTCWWVGTTHDLHKSYRFLCTVREYVDYDNPVAGLREIKLFVNGYLRAGKTIPYTMPNVPRTIYVGGSPYPHVGLFDGTLKDIWIFNSSVNWESAIVPTTMTTTTRSTTTISTSTRTITTLTTSSTVTEADTVSSTTSSSTWTTTTSSSSTSLTPTSTTTTTVSTTKTSSSTVSTTTTSSSTTKTSTSTTSSSATSTNTTTSTTTPTTTLSTTSSSTATNTTTSATSSTASTSSRTTATTSTSSNTTATATATSSTVSTVSTSTSTSSSVTATATTQTATTATTTTSTTTSTSTSTFTSTTTSTSTSTTSSSTSTSLTTLTLTTSTGTTRTATTSTGTTLTTTTSRTTTSTGTSTSTTTTTTTTATCFCPREAPAANQNDAAALVISMTLDGVDVAKLNQEAVRLSHISAVEDGILHVVKSTSVGVPSALTTALRLLQSPRRLGSGSEGRWLQQQTAGSAQVETNVEHPASGQLFTALQDATTDLQNAVQDRLKAVGHILNVSGVSILLGWGDARRTCNAIDDAVTLNTSVMSTTTVPSSVASQEQAIANILNVVLADSQAQVARLAESNETTIIEKQSGWIISASKFGALFTTSDGTAKAAVVLQVPEGNVSVTMPTSLLDSLPAGLLPEQVAIVVAASDSSSQASNGTSDAENGVQGVLVVELRGPDGPLNVSGLSEPIQLGMPTVFNPNMRSSCVFWDEELEDWSTKGLTRGDNQEGGQYICLTTHLSIFGVFLQGFLDAILCSQFTLFTSEGLAQIVQGTWYQLRGSLVYWCWLGILLVTFASAMVIDRARGRESCRFSKEYFLVAEHEMKLEPTDDRSSRHAAAGSADSEEESHPKGLLCRLCCFCTSVVAVVCACCQETAARDALDEVMANWFENFSEVRTCLEAIVGGLQFGALSAGRLLHISRNIMCQTTLVASRRLACGTLFLSEDTVGFILTDEDLKELLVRRHAVRKELCGVPALSPSDSAPVIISGTSRTSTSTSRMPLWRCTDQVEVWFNLHKDVVEEVYQQISEVSCRGLPRIVASVYLMRNPFGVIFCRDVFFGCAMRCFFIALEVNGSLMVAALFFSASGGVKGKPSGDADPAECGEESEDIVYQVGRAVAVAMGSVLLAGLPVMLLESLHTRSFKTFEYRGCPQWKRQLSAWCLQDAFIWIMGSLYFGFQVFCIVLFLANIGEEDHVDYATTAMICFFQEMFVLPLSVAFLLPSIAVFLMKVNSCLGDSRSALVTEVQCKLLAETNSMLPTLTI